MWPSSHISRPWLRWYEPGVPAELEIPEIPVTRLLDDAAGRRPRGTALIFFGRRIRYRQLRTAADRFAAGLHRFGVQPGDRVALILPNCPQLVIAFFGTLRRGAIPVPLNPLHTEEELRHQLADCEARLAVVLDRSYAALDAIGDKVSVEHVVVTSLLDFLPPLKRLALRLPLVQTQRRRARLTAEVPSDAGLLRFAELQRPAQRRVRQYRLDPAKHLAAIQYTGGTGGLPKGAMLTHRNLIANACQQQAWDTGCRDGGEVTLAVLPLFHSFGMLSCMIAPVMRAGAVVLLPRFDGEQVIKALRRHKPTIFPGVPTLYDHVLDSPRLAPGDLDSVRIFLSGGVELPPDTAARLEALGGDRLIQCYGLTEASPAVTGNPLGGGARNTTMGVPLPMTDALIVDPDEPTRVLPYGEPGELVVRGPQVFAGYWNAPLETAQVLSKGWLRTGDMAVMDEIGFVTILERRRDVIKVSGFSVFPSEVEEVLRRHPAVFDCAVAGVRDERRRGERVVAYVVEHPAYPFSADELHRHCERFLSHYKVPAAFVPCTDLPRTMLGKLQRHELRERTPSPEPSP
ncbi:AMP-binding protein [Actinomadura fulvescens]|uniref:Long-chain fatty acid--CoA ligase n=1 Tax=Actinomadura fulvescens TaxID=46160 RepID=A0ABN3PHQ2_9ACTN